ncbi:hypothetical protein RDWZM_000073 [Blomia tropicalis]|uniref:BTB domain-containing protein n=1 Tax=Blomia tropicalis TaxID=40697 RepID=A0A9Q0RML9_BLOTA|nr:hypothetical protein RDWZM_000073 [Blomia tropicalis]
MNPFFFFLCSLLLLLTSTPSNAQSETTTAGTMATDSNIVTDELLRIDQTIGSLDDTDTNKEIESITDQVAMNTTSETLPNNVEEVRSDSPIPVNVNGATQQGPIVPSSSPIMGRSSSSISAPNFPHSSHPVQQRRVTYHQRHIPAYFGNPFRPAMVRSQDSSFIALPPKEKPTFDSTLCMSQQQDANTKRDLEQQRLDVRHLGSFYLNPKNQDVVFSVCGQLIPAHLVVIESISPKLEEKIVTNRNGNTEPIVINDIADLVPMPFTSSSSSEKQIDLKDDTLTSGDQQCPNSDLLIAFQTFLKFFYVGGQAFDEITNLDVATMVWHYVHTFIDDATVQQQIEIRIGQLITLDSLSKVYRFAKTNQIASIDRKWSEFINANSNALTETDDLPTRCSDIDGDIEYLDRFIEALNVNQTMAIRYIRSYLSTCPESSSFVITKNNPFPRSLLYFRCTIDDLKELVNMGFLSYEGLAQELENRLRNHERQCEEKCMTRHGATRMNPIFHNVRNHHIARPQQSRQFGTVFS